MSRDFLQRLLVVFAAGWILAVCGCTASAGNAGGTAKEPEHPPASFERQARAPAANETGARTGAPDPADRDPNGIADRLDHLKALPYSGFDPGTDKELSGVTRFDRDEASPGYDLYTDDKRKVYLADLSGRQVHQWTVPAPYRWCEWAVMLGKGEILAVCVNRGLVRLDWNSSLIWSVDRKVHHDVTLKPDGNILTLAHSVTTYMGRDVMFDSLLTISPGGKVLREWSTLDHLGELKRLHGPTPLDVPPPPGHDPNGKAGTMDYYHTNTVEALPETPLGARDRRFRAGNILVSLRNVNTILILDQDDDSVTWSWGPGELELQHTPTMLPNGHILVFDNGTYRGFSRVLEIEPASGRIVWQFEGDPPESFYSKGRGSAQRLRNGNTLICEAERGHAFEVTPGGKIVWEFWNTDLSKAGHRRRIYRMRRYPVSSVAALLSGDSRTGPGTGSPAGRAQGQ